MASEDRDYPSRVASEKEFYSEKQIEVHDLPDIFHYWSNRYLKPRLEEASIADIPDFFAQPAVEVSKRRPGRLRIASLGAGDGQFEVAVAHRILGAGVTDLEIECYEINEEVIARGRAAVREAGLEGAVGFVRSDLNRAEIGDGYDLVFASHSLHHFVELEKIFARVKEILPAGGLFIINDMIGRNGHMRWPEALEVIELLWKLLPRRFKFNHLLQRWEEKFINHDCSTEGFEGIRAQDILPLLVQDFEFEYFLAFGGITDPFVDRCFGPNLDPGDPFDRAFIDFAALLNERLIRDGSLTPTQMFAWLTVGPPSSVRGIHPKPPHECVRQPDPSIAAVQPTPKPAGAWKALRSRIGRMRS